MSRVFNIPETLLGLREQLGMLGEADRILAKPTHWDKVAWLLNKLANTHHWDRQAGRDDYRNLKMEKLRALMGKRYADQVMRVLLDNDIIESDNHYSPGSYSKGYRLTEQHRLARKVCVFHAGSRFWEKLARINRAPEGERYLAACLRHEVGFRYVDAVRELLPGYEDELMRTAYDGTKFDLLDERQLALWNDHLRGIEDELAKLPTTLKPKTGHKLARKSARRKKRRKRKVDYRARLTSMLLAAGRIFTQQFVVKRDSKGNRLHTNISNLAGELRQYLVLGGHTELVNTDIPASQLVFACIPLLTHYRELGEVPEDVYRWVRLCTSPDPYERLHLEFYRETFDEAVAGRYYQLLEDESQARAAYRKDFKGHLFQQLYYSELKYNLGPLTSYESQCMWEYYPNVMRWLTDQKQGDHAAFACNMQRAEAAFVIDRFGHQASVWQIPCVTVHDSAIIPAIHSRLVLDYFQAYFDAQLADTRARVHMKAECYDEQAAQTHQNQYQLF